PGTEIDVAERLRRRAGCLGPGESRGAETASRIAGRGLHEQACERPLPQDASVGHYVERHAAGHAEVGEAGALMEIGRLLQQDLLQHCLEAARHVPMEPGDLAASRAGRSPEEIAEPAGVHLTAAYEIETGEVEPVLSARAGS